MTVCHNSPRESEPAFICTPYVTDAQGRLRPTEGITQCPRAKGAEQCRMKKHDWRERKTGPCIAVRLLYCRSHDRHFTVYPMGHVPYSRMRMLPVDVAGHPIDSSEDRKVDNQEAAVRWKGSWFRIGRGCLRGQAVAARALE
jgi:hypothetical protein